MRLLILLLSLLSQTWAFKPDWLKDHELFYEESTGEFVHFARLKDWKKPSEQVWVGLGFGDGDRMRDKILAFQCGVRSDGKINFRYGTYEKNQPFQPNSLYNVRANDGKCEFNKQTGVVKITLKRTKGTVRLDHYRVISHSFTNNVFIAEGMYVEMFWLFLKHFKTPKHQDQGKLMEELKKPPQKWPSSSNRFKPGMLTLATLMVGIAIFVLL